ncbi:hypothetical protein ERX37_06535 [Macrococcus hajekii]|uniref:Uncharacterized protein n=1 Tax=Macrococcus hajekii TaxID=198482 RepID=A0A4R6BJH8_9STAP|nr:hypothetical protein [Macrococcus hajekii]TDM01862.1 hypothetical protein ERX37_06535 [Macrococcus hajekii]GGB08123.1 hypothetical protein GCM10007190_15090 [Macrococcus hajekii]
MQKVLMLLSILMHIVLIAGYFINSGIIFFTSYFWIIFCLISLFIGLHYHFSKVNLNEKDLTYRILAIILTISSSVSLIFLLYITFINPFLYLDMR